MCICMSVHFVGFGFGWVMLKLYTIMWAITTDFQWSQCDFILLKRCWVGLRMHPLLHSQMYLNAREDALQTWPNTYAKCLVWQSMHAPCLTCCASCFSSSLFSWYSQHRIFKAFVHEKRLKCDKLINGQSEWWHSPVKSGQNVIMCVDWVKPFHEKHGMVWAKGTDMDIHWSVPFSKTGIGLL